MKLDATDLRYITNEEFRVLTAVSEDRSIYKHNLITLLQVEMGSKNHEVVPSSLVAQIAGLRNGGINKLLGQLAQRNLIARVQNTKCRFRGPLCFMAAQAYTQTTGIG
jgi:RIO kinase 2